MYEFLQHPRIFAPGPLLAPTFWTITFTRFVSDIGVKDGKVATIGRISKDASCKREIDASGKHICPGFVWE